MCGACQGQCRQGLPVEDMLRFLTYADGYGQFALGREHFLSLAPGHVAAELRRLRLLHGGVPPRRQACRSGCFARRRSSANPQSPKKARTAAPAESYTIGLEVLAMCRHITLSSVALLAVYPLPRRPAKPARRSASSKATMTSAPWCTPALCNMRPARHTYTVVGSGETCGRAPTSSTSCGRKPAAMSPSQPT